MPFITSAERYGIEKGVEIGRSEGVEIGRSEGMLSEAREMVLDALDTKFSSEVPQDIEELINNMNMLPPLSTGPTYAGYIRDPD